MAEGYLFSLVYKEQLSRIPPVIPQYVSKSVVRHNCRLKMCGFQVTVPLQVICRLMVATQVDQNVTVPCSSKPALAQTTDSRVLPSGYVAFPQFGFAYKISIIRLSYNDARKMCLEENGQLALIDSREKVAKILDHFGFTKAWVGLGKGTFYEPSEWVTINGKPTNNLPWGNGEPGGNSKCVSLGKSVNGLINHHCDVSYNYLCEIALPRH